MTNTREIYSQTILPTYAPPSPVFVRGQGSRLWDENGREYIDFGGGIAVLSLGHCPPSLSAAISEQADTLMHLSNLHVHPLAGALAQKLCAATFADKVFLCNSGTEANEAALKLARRRGVSRQPEKYHTLSFTNSFHGRVGLAMAATGQEKNSLRLRPARRRLSCPAIQRPVGGRGAHGRRRMRDYRRTDSRRRRR